MTLLSKVTKSMNINKTAFKNNFMRTHGCFCGIIVIVLLI